ncbi:MAG: hypothetical protein U0599_08265 [Vicinamibacteria bacterium]
MKGYLVRVGIDQAFGKWNAPIDAETGDFVYVPIPEKAGTAFQPGMAIGYEPFRAAVTAFSVRHPGATRCLHATRTAERPQPAP